MNKEIRRQLVHIFLGIFLIMLIDLGLLHWQGIGILMLIMLGILYLNHIKYEPAQMLVHYYDRKDAYLPGWGAITYFAGFLVATLLFPKNIALAALAIMVLGDGMSTIIGVFFGKTKLSVVPKKTVEGTLACLVFAFAGALLFVPLWMAVLGSLVGTLVEVFEKKHPIFDDNHLMPLLSGLAMVLFLFL